MEKVYLLWHTHTFDDGREDDKVLGVYESEAAATDAQARVSGQPRKGQFSIRINDRWRICFAWPEGAKGPSKVEIVDYH